MKKERGRFAPSPSGRMHLGNLFSSLLAWLDVKSLGGDMVLRIEDLDTDRCFLEYTKLLADDLAWLGLDWDEGWGMGGDRGPRCQSKRGDFYAKCFQKLEGRGLVYPCYCSRAQRLAASAPHLGDGRRTYDGRCYRLSQDERKLLEASGRKPAWRVRVPEREISFTDGHYGSVRENLAQETGDLILRRSDGVYAYQLAVTADDGAMGITRVVRGRDLLSSTPGQLWLMEELGYPAPSYIHLPLLSASGGRKLSKRDGDLNMDTLRQRYTPRELTGLLAFLAGLAPSPFSVSPSELTEAFSWDRVPRDDIILTPELI